MRGDTGAMLGMALGATGMTIGSWLSVTAAISGVQSATNTAAEAGIFIGSVACVYGLSMAFLAIWYRRLAKAGKRR